MAISAHESNQGTLRIYLVSLRSIDLVMPGVWDNSAHPHPFQSMVVSSFIYSTQVSTSTTCAFNSNTCLHLYHWCLHLQLLWTLLQLHLPPLLWPKSLYLIFLLHTEKVYSLLKILLFIWLLWAIIFYQLLILLVFLPRLLCLFLRLEANLFLILSDHKLRLK